MVAGVSKKKDIFKNFSWEFLIILGFQIVIQFILAFISTPYLGFGEMTPLMGIAAFVLGALSLVINLAV